jgi:hypothetical protein
MSTESYVHYCASKTQELLTECIDESQSGFFPINTIIHPMIRETLPSTCCTTAYSHKCNGPEAHVVHVPIFDNSEGHRKECPVCSANEAGTKAVKTFHELCAYNWKTLRFLELTTPEDFILPEEYDHPDAVRSKCNLLFRLGKRYMDRCHPNEPYIAFLHHWHSNNPLSPPHLHLHIVASCTSYEIDASRQITSKHHSPHVPKETLLRHRGVWAHLLGVQECDIFYRYAPRRERHHKGKSYGGPGRLMHRLKYCYRAYIQDVNIYFSKNENESMTPERHRWLAWHLQEFPRRVRRYRAWAPRAQKKFIYRQTVTTRIQQHFNQITLHCPKCFYDISPLPTDYEPSALDSQLLAVRERVTYRRPPDPCMREVSPLPESKLVIPIHQLKHSRMQLKGWSHCQP